MRPILLALLFLAMSLPLVAQTRTVINGSEHPELIPDEAAARSVFNVHSMFKTAADSANSEKHHAKIGFSAADHAVYDSAMQTHFNSRSARSATYGNLLKTLSPDGQAKLKAFIQAEKATMQYTIAEPIEQGGQQ